MALEGQARRERGLSRARRTSVKKVTIVRETTVHCGFLARCFTGPTIPKGQVGSPSRQH